MLYNGMASTRPVAALYFIALMTFGNYVLFNLLVAILVEGFQTEVTHGHTETNTHTHTRHHTQTPMHIRKLIFADFH